MNSEIFGSRNKHLPNLQELKNDGYSTTSDRKGYVYICVWNICAYTYYILNKHTLTACFVIGKIQVELWASYEKKIES